MKRSTLIGIWILMCCSLIAQNDPLSAFAPLIGKTWKAEGTWSNGGSFKQITQFEYALNEKIIIAKSQGFTDQEQTTFGERNHGIRKYDGATGKIRFWEFDVFGGLTTGEVQIDGSNLYYVYEYGGAIITDAWIANEDGTYQFIVGSIENGNWRQKYLECTFKAE